MKRKAAFLPLLAVPLCVLTSCGGTAVTENTVELKKGGKVVEYIVEDFEASYYDADEMKSFIDSQVEAYLEEHDGTIKVSKDKVEDGVAYVTITYESADTYADFTGTVLYAGSVLQAQTAGYDFDTDFISADDAEAAEEKEDSSAEPEKETGTAEEDTLSSEAEEDSSSDVSGDFEEDGASLADAEAGDDISSDEEAAQKDESLTDVEEQEDTSSAIEGTIIASSSYISGREVLEEYDLKVLIIDTDVTVIVPGTIKYVSAEGVTIVDENTVSVQIPGSADTPVYILYE